MSANKELGPYGLQLYLYLASNADGFNLELSPQAAENAAGITRTTFYKYLRLLEIHGYLVWHHSNGYDFYTIPQLCQADIVVSFKVKVGTGGWIPDTMTVGALKTDWQSGKQYTYTLTLTDTRLTYTTGISNWNNRE